MKIAIILGTRPEIIKMSPIIRECENSGYNYFIIHSNQHYSKELDKVFFDELLLPSPKYNLNIGSGTHGEITGKMLVEIEKVLITERPDIVFVQGDTNTVLAGGLAASKLMIPVAHVEAGLRSRDRSMPEELNRIVVDHLSDYLFCPTGLAKKNLQKEGISKNKIFVTGNTVVDALLQNIQIAESRNDIVERLNVVPKNYILVTSHRQENVDNEERLKNIFRGLENLAKAFKCPIILPAHPRLVKKIQEFAVIVNDKIKLIDPIGYMDFLVLERNALLIVTDSGGVQEEACIIGTPCITLRENTERPETIHVGSNLLAGTNPSKILNAAKKILKGENIWKNPFGDGKSAELILETIMK